ncbi:hypothetical protein N657DRAFT_681933 [Parathielavia appendiculata]|uniref:Uncharacterized protein n=1 Tax=Parathielavia appendiculata TaxID=2587402 RepID=A0AAN6Z1I1_9PEZI|nr:hypothetical protein N657DRAFT_681933 [Parathielavia appendiculata]
MQQEDQRLVDAVYAHDRAWKQIASKRHIQQSLSGAQQTSKTQYLSMALNIMRARLFEYMVGEQAIKSAKAGSAPARKSGNVLWMSVVDGMLAQSFEM